MGDAAPAPPAVERAAERGLVEVEGGEEVDEGDGGGDLVLTAKMVAKAAKKREREEARLAREAEIEAQREKREKREREELTPSWRGMRSVFLRWTISARKYKKESVCCVMSFCVGCEWGSKNTFYFV